MEETKEKIQGFFGRYHVKEILCGAAIVLSVILSGILILLGDEPAKDALSALGF